MYIKIHLLILINTLFKLTITSSINPQDLDLNIYNIYSGLIDIIMAISDDPNNNYVDTSEIWISFARKDTASNKIEFLVYFDFSDFCKTDPSIRQHNLLTQKKLGSSEKEFKDKKYNKNINLPMHVIAKIKFHNNIALRTIVVMSKEGWGHKYTPKILIDHLNAAANIFINNYNLLMSSFQQDSSKSNSNNSKFEKEIILKDKTYVYQGLEDDLLLQRVIDDIDIIPTNQSTTIVAIEQSRFDKILKINKDTDSFQKMFLSGIVEHIAFKHKKIKKDIKRDQESEVKDIHRQRKEEEEKEQLGSNNQQQIKGGLSIDNENEEEEKEELKPKESYNLIEGNQPSLELSRKEKKKIRDRKRKKRKKLDKKNNKEHKQEQSVENDKPIQQQINYKNNVYSGELINNDNLNITQHQQQQLNDTLINFSEMHSMSKKPEDLSGVHLIENEAFKDAKGENEKVENGPIRLLESEAMAKLSKELQKDIKDSDELLQPPYPDSILEKAFNKYETLLTVYPFEQLGSFIEAIISLLKTILHITHLTISHFRDRFDKEKIKHITLLKLATEIKSKYDLLKHSCLQTEYNKVEIYLLSYTLVPIKKIPFTNLYDTFDTNSKRVYNFMYKAVHDKILITSNYNKKLSFDVINKFKKVQDEKISVYENNIKEDYVDIAVKELQYELYKEINSEIVKNNIKILSYELNMLLVQLKHGIIDLSNETK